MITFTNSIIPFHILSPFSISYHPLYTILALNALNFSQKNIGMWNKEINFKHKGDRIMFGFSKRKKKKQLPFRRVTLYAVADGQLISIEEVNDIVFSANDGYDGFAIVPSNGEISAPVQVKLVNVFPTKHAGWFQVWCLRSFYSWELILWRLTVAIRHQGF